MGGVDCCPGRVKGEGPLGKCGERGDAANVRKSEEGCRGGSDGCEKGTGPLQSGGVKSVDGRLRGSRGGGE